MVAISTAVYSSVFTSWGSAPGRAQVIGDPHGRIRALVARMGKYSEKNSPKSSSFTLGFRPT